MKSLPLFLLSQLVHHPSHVERYPIGIHPSRDIAEKQANELKLKSFEILSVPFYPVKL